MRDQSATYELITPPPLKTRVGKGAGIDAELAQRANSVVRHMRKDFLHRVNVAVVAIAKAIDNADRLEHGADELASEMIRSVRELEMQGVALGFTLMGEICASLCRYLAQLEASDGMSAKIVRAHTDALRSAARNAIEGDGDDVGRALIHSLNELVARG